MSRRFVSTRSTVPPTGVWFFSLGDDHYESPIYDDAVRHVADILKRHGVVDVTPAQALADHMCPQLPSYFCVGDGPSSPVVSPHDAKLNAMKYFGMQVETVDEIVRRMQICQTCPRHRRDYCLHCHGYDSWIVGHFGGRRVKLPVDDASGCCTCAGTFEAVIGSVVYQDGEPAWDGAPDTCWRKALP